MSTDQKLWIEAILLCFAALWACLITLSPPPRRRRVQVFTWSEEPLRLCGYHTGSTMRIGQVTILDSSNCEECFNERKKTGA